MVDAFSLKLQRDNRKNALAVDPFKGKTGKKLYFSPHCGNEKQPHTITKPNYMLFLQFSAGGLHDWGILLVISLEFQGKEHQPFSYGTAFSLSYVWETVDASFFEIPSEEP